MCRKAIVQSTMPTARNYSRMCVADAHAACLIDIVYLGPCAACSTGAPWRTLRPRARFRNLVAVPFPHRLHGIEHDEWKHGGNFSVYLSTVSGFVRISMHVRAFACSCMRARGVHACIQAN